jgi:hypothetical protein
MKTVVLTDEQFKRVDDEIGESLQAWQIFEGNLISTMNSAEQPQRAAPEYYVVYERGENIDEVATTYLRRKWIPVGGISVTVIDGESFFAQAFRREASA